MNASEVVEQLMQRGVLVTPEMLERIKAGHTPSELISSAPRVEIIESYDALSEKRTIDHAYAYYQRRFEALEKLLRARSEMSGVGAIGRLKAKTDNDTITIIAMVVEKIETRNKHIMLTLEDTTGQIRAIIRGQDEQLWARANDICCDEVIGVTGRMGNDIIFVSDITHPDIPFLELKKSPDEAYLALVGDVHYGSREFLADDFAKMIAWLRGETGSEEQRRLASKVRYVLFTGDLVEGVGVYPGQEDDLLIPDLHEQYTRFAEELRHIPERMRIIIGPGNHDAARIAEPQPLIYKEYAQALYDLPNVTMISSPATIRIARTTAFPGFIILYYHGYSMIYYADNVPSIRAAGGQKRCDMIMKWLMTRRHLAPTHTSHQNIYDATRDPMVITHVPDLFITGHIHRTTIANYKGVTMVNASCWTDITEDQEKRGIEPQPGRLPLINLQTREVKVLNFFRQ